MINQKTIESLFRNKTIDLINFSESIIDDIRSDKFDILQAITDIKSDLIQWVKSGILLGEIKKEFSHFILRNKLAKNWSDFCKKLLNRSHWYTDRLIEASQVVIILIKKGFKILPNCEAQARELVKFLPDHENYLAHENELLEKEITAKWQEVIDISKQENKPITAGLILKVVDREKSEQSIANIRLPKHIKETLKDMALENGSLTINEFLEKLAIDYKIAKEADQETLSQEKLEEWEKDLHSLLEEKEVKDKKYKGFATKSPGNKTEKKTTQKQSKPQERFNFSLGVISIIADIVKNIEKMINPDLRTINFNTT